MVDQTSTQDKWNKLTTEDAARELGLEIASVQNAMRQGKLRATKLGRQWFLDENAIKEYRINHLGKVGRPTRTKGN